MKCALDMRLLNDDSLVPGLIQRFLVFKVKDGIGTERVVVRVDRRETPAQQVVDAFAAEIPEWKFDILGGGELTHMPHQTHCVFIRGGSPDIDREPDPILTLAIFKRALDGFLVSEFPA